MTADELTAACNRLELSESDLAAELGVTVAIVRAWLRGQLPIPREYGETVAFRVAMEERVAVLAGSGITCEWMERWDALPVPAGMEQELAHFEGASQHAENCETCVAANAYVTARLGPPPKPPMSATVRGIVAIGDATERVPKWARPALGGAALLFSIVLLRVFLMIPAIIADPGAHLPAALLALAMGPVGGAMGGFAYSVVRGPFRRLGPAGDYLTGVVVVITYMLSLAAVAPIAFGETMIEKPSDLVIFVVLSVIFGLVLGRTWFRSGRSH